MTHNPNSNTFNPHQWATPRSQTDIVNARHNKTPFLHGSTEVVSPGLDQVVRNVTSDPGLFTQAIYNAMRIAPSIREFEFRFADFEDSEVTVEKRTDKQLVKEAKESIATTIANSVARDATIVSVFLDQEGHLNVTRLRNGDRYTEDMDDRADPKFIVAYTRIS